MEIALYHPQFGYYARSENPVRRGGDYVTAPALSPAFSFAIAGLFREFVRRGEGVVCSFVDIGCGDGSLVRAVAAQVEEKNVRFFGVDRSLERALECGGGVTAFKAAASSPQSREITFLHTIDEVPNDGLHLLFSNELFDAIPFARLVKRGEHIHELWVHERDESLDWSEHEAAPIYEDYFEERGIELAENQFADVSLEWGAYYADLVRFVTRGLIVTIDYGYSAAKLFHPRARRFGTAAAYVRHRVHRDLLADPGEQDLTAHINFDDLQRAGEAHGAKTLLFERLARFLLAIGITGHELFRPVQEVGISGVEEGVKLIDSREDARRLVLPDGIGDEMRVLVQARGIDSENWSFQRKLF